MHRRFQFFLLVPSKLVCIVGLGLPTKPSTSSQTPPEFSAQEDPFLHAFEDWRFGNDTSFVTGGDVEGVVPVFDAPLEVLGECAKAAVADMPGNQVSLQTTGAAAEGAPPRMFFTDDRLTEFVDHVDHIYVLCLQCTRTLPPKLMKKVSILNGRLSDGCLARTLHLQSMTHRHRVTLAHRVAIMDAKVRGFKLALVLEEDMVFKKDVSQFDYAPVEKLMHDTAREWEVIRLAWFDWKNLLAAKCKAEKARGCDRWVDQSMCTIPRCILHSSAAYILPARSYDQFLTQGCGQIDYRVLNQFNQTVMTPPLGNQPFYKKEELETEGGFIKKCKGVVLRDPLH